MPDQPALSIIYDGAGMLHAALLDRGCAAPSAAPVSKKSSSQAGRMPGT